MRKNVNGLFWIQQYRVIERRTNDGDNFNYEYYSGTNRLMKVIGSTTHYTYDFNENMISDLMNNNFAFKYDYRNLITEMQNTSNINYTFQYLYRYVEDPPRRNEAGNRIQKITYRSDYQPPPPIRDGDNPGADWVFVSQEYYIRDMSGKELAIYSRDEKGRFSLKFWNVWGLSNEGQITSDNNKYYYLKDHLGSIRAVYDGNINLVSAQDYDAWGYALMNRTFGSIGKYQFTSKERDVESSYDYFGARYYDSRIGRWDVIDPLFEKYLTFSPYSYVLNNPLIFKDPNGKWKSRYDENTGRIYVTAEEGDKLEDLYNQMGLSKEEFYEKYINDQKNFKLKAGLEFDITEAIVINAKFSKDATDMNCFSSSFTAVGLLDEEIAVKRGASLSQNAVTSLGFKEETELKSGYMKTFENTEGLTYHAAIFVVRSQKGIEYYFGRPGPDSKLSIQTSDRLNQLYPDFRSYIFSYPKTK